jgi:RNA polymerase sigma-70 factor (ECF subfamily)
MSADSPDVLLEKLCSGDDAAAQQAFLAYEPYLRMMVRRQLSPRVRPKFDSSDVVQSVWVNLLQSFHKGRWHFDDAPHLRAFLVKVTRNLFLNRIRRHKHALQHEVALAGRETDSLRAPSQPRPSEVAQADDVWERLLALCPLAHRELLTLKRQGLSLEEIAERTGLHPSSVRRVLYDLARRYAFKR